MTIKDIYTTVNDVEQGTSFIEADERDKLLPLRELQRLDKQLRTIRGSLEVALQNVLIKKIALNMKKENQMKYKIQLTQMIKEI